MEKKGLLVKNSRKEIGVHMKQIEEQPQEKQPQYINSIIRATNILELYAKLDRQYLGIAEISKELELQKTTVFNIMKTLVHQGWLVQDSPSGKYRLGTRILRVSAMAARNISTEAILIQEMQRLRDEYNEDVVLTTLVDDVPICVEKIQSSNALRIHSRVGRVSCLVKGSTGKALLTWQPDDFIETTLDQNFSDDATGRRERQKMREELARIRNQGYCISISEQDAGVA
ncbi:MAG: IclR family transcriptional regulator, partial [Lawsonibacter sp.]|nr:IclR family transcriptional regulator [Lawsonibacter sp.]